MNIKLKPILFELIWLLACLCLSMSILFIIGEWDPKYHLITVRILGTPVAFSDSDLLYTSWLLVILFVYCIKEVRWKFKRTVPNTIAILAGLLFIVSLSFLHAGWTSYPSLSSLGHEGLTSGQFGLIIIVFRIVAGLLLGIVIFKWLKNRSLQLPQSL